jgi:serine protease Do
MTPKTSLIALGLTVGLLGSAEMVRGQDEIKPLQSRQEKLASETSAAIVGFGQRRFARGGSITEQHDAMAGGAGFLIDAQGYILTTSSLAPEKGRIDVTLRGHLRAAAHVVGHDPRTQVALLKLDDPEATAKLCGGKLPHLTLGKSSDLRIGRIVATVGNPFDSIKADGVPGFSIGVVSSLGRVRDADAYKGFAIETDAAVNPGSFGGPLVDLEGRAVGLIVEAISPKRWLGVAIPMDEIVMVLDDLKAGRVPAGPRLGLSVATSGATTDGTVQAKGLSVSEVEGDGPAAKAGLKVGDRILSLDGAKIVEAYDLEHEMAELTQGSPVEIGLVRDGKALNLTVTLGAGKVEAVAAKPATDDDDDKPAARPAKPVKADAKPYAGMNVEEKDGGVFVKEVVPGGPANAAKLEVGDKLVKVGDKVVSGRKDVIEAITSKAPGDKVVLRIERDGWQKTLEITLGTKGGATTEKPSKPSKGSKRGFLGVAAAPSEDEKAGGVMVNMVVPGSAAETAKIQKGDVIQEIDGKKTPDIDSFMAALKDRKAGDKVKLKLTREGWERNLEVTLGERPADLDAPQDDAHGGGKDDGEEPAKPAKASKPWLGFSFVDKEGSFEIDEVAKGSPAEKAGLKKGDVVQGFKALDDLEKAITAKKVGDAFTLEIEREGWKKAVTMTLAAKPEDK